MLQSNVIRVKENALNPVPSRRVRYASLHQSKTGSDHDRLANCDGNGIDLMHGRGRVLQSALARAAVEVEKLRLTCAEKSLVCS